MISKSNQIIAKEGVLTYPQHGRVYKPWSELSKHIGKEVPIRKNHDGEVIGKAKIKQCPIGKNLLCADMFLNLSDASYKGYSIGTISQLEETKGAFGLEEYNRIQRIIDIDHIAITESPRDQNALTDSVPTDVFIKKNEIEYIRIIDSFEFSEENKVSEKMNVKTDEQANKAVLDDLTSKIKTLTEENQKLKMILDSFERAERERLVEEIKKKVPKAEINDEIGINQLRFGLKLLNAYEPAQPVKDEVPKRPLENIIKKIEGEDSQYDFLSLYKPKGGK